MQLKRRMEDLARNSLLWLKWLAFFFFALGVGVSLYGTKVLNQGFTPRNSLNFTVVMSDPPNLCTIELEAMLAVVVKSWISIAFTLTVMSRGVFDIAMGNEASFFNETESKPGDCVAP
jgi:multidrug efflux pump subunit AcrB